jgi:hypothetical protein
VRERTLVCESKVTWIDRGHEVEIGHRPRKNSNKSNDCIGVRHSSMQHADIDATSAIGGCGATSARARCQQHPHAHSSATKIMMMNKLPSAIFAIACGFLATAVHGPPRPAPPPTLTRSARRGSTERSGSDALTLPPRMRPCPQLRTASTTPTWP